MGDGVEVGGGVSVGDGVEVSGDEEMRDGHTSTDDSSSLFFWSRRFYICHPPRCFYICHPCRHFYICHASRQVYRAPRSISDKPGDPAHAQLNVTMEYFRG